MRKVILWMMSLLMMILPAAAEENQGAVQIGVITEVQLGTPVDLDGSGTTETVQYEILKDEDGWDIGYRMSVNEMIVEGEGWAMNEKVYVLRIDQYDTLLLVSDYGPSDDHETHFYLYNEDALLSVGSILAHPENMRVENEIITAPVRGKLLYTWFHDADFALASYWGEDGEADACIYQIPRYLYQMGLMVKLKTDLPLSVSMTNPEIAHIFEAGEEVVLCASDDVEWVYIQSAHSSAGGWMKVGGEFGMDCVVGDQLMDPWDVFDGLLFAD